MPALQQFFKDERLRRGWSVREAAQRSQISPSKAYAIENGDDNVEFETFENIATAFDLTPAELAVAIGKGTPALNPDEARWVSYYRRIPVEQRPFIEKAVYSIGEGPVQPIVPKPPRRRSQSRSSALDRPNGDNTRLIRSHLGIANRLFRGSGIGDRKANRVAA